MGYVDISHPDVTSASLKTAYRAVLDDGIDYSSNVAYNNDEKTATIKNMWLKNGVLTSRKKLRDTGFVIDGESIHSQIFCFGSKFIHAGSALYCIDDEGIKKLFVGIPDKNSFFASFSGKTYLYCDTYVYSVDRNLNVVEEMPYCPVYSKNCLPNSGFAIKDDDFVPNIIAPIFRMYYQKDVSLPSNKYYFPQIMDQTRRFWIYIDDKLIDEADYNVYDDGFGFTSQKVLKDDSTVSICCYSNNVDFEKCNIIAGCKTAVSYGGGTVNGTRILAAGNPDYPGKYFYSEMAQPLNFKESLYGIAGDGTQDITAFSKQYSDLLVFTDSTVSRIRYNYTDENGGYFSVYLINSGIGCDVPSGVSSVGNRTVFANSKKGLFIVDSTENFDVMNIQPISRNIMDENGKKGYFSLNIEDRKAAFTAIYDQKLMLLCRDRVFIWDFGNSPYVSSSDYVKAAKQLTWFEFDGFEGVVTLFSSDTTLYAVKKNDDGFLSLYEFSDEGEECTYAYKSGNSALTYPFDDKYVLNFRANFITGKKTTAQILFYADGKMYASLKASIVPDKNGQTAFFARIPKYSARLFAFEIKTEAPDVGIANVGFDYVVRRNTERYSK